MMFYHCLSLISIDLSSFDTSTVTDMAELFYGCLKLEYINIKNFTQTEGLKSNGIFSRISNKATICLNPKKVPDIYDLAIQNNIKLDNTEKCLLKCNKENPFGKVQEQICTDFCGINDMANNLCILNYVYEGITDNLILFNIRKDIITSNFDHNVLYQKNNSIIIKGGNVEFIITTNNIIKKDKNALINLGKCENKLKNYYNLPVDDNLVILIINIKNISNGQNKDKIGFEIYAELEGNIYLTKLDLNICYNILTENEISKCDNYSIESFIQDSCISCFKNYYPIYNNSLDKNSFIKCYNSPEGYFLNKNEEYYQKCYLTCSSCKAEGNFDNHNCLTCKNGYIYETNFLGEVKCNQNITKIDSKEAEQKILENIKEKIIRNINTSKIDAGEDIIIKQKYSTITITTTDNQNDEIISYPSNSTSINFSKCEKILKEKNGLPEKKSLYIIKLDVKQEGFKIPKIEYEVYYQFSNSSLKKLSLSVCANMNIDITRPVSFSENIDIINSSSKYYNDICYTFTTEDGTDITLKDRKKYFVDNNLTVCEEDCDFTNYNSSSEKATCSCKIKTDSTFKISDIVIDKDKLLKSFTDFKNIANIKVLKCNYLIFAKEAFKSNYANIFMIIIIVFFLVVLILFWFKFFSELIKILNVITLKKKFSKNKEKLNRVERKDNKKKKNNKKDKNLIKSEYKKLKSRNPNINESGQIIMSENKTNPVKKKINEKKLNKNEVKNKNKNKIKKVGNDLNNRIVESEITQTNILKKNDVSIGMGKKELYEMFLKINKRTDSELNSMDYKEAIQEDKRNYWEYYLSLVRTKHLLFFSFWPSFDYNSRILKIYLFSFNFTVSFFVNALFFNDDTMHKIYTEKGSFDFIYNIPQILYSSLISGFINALIQALSMTESNLIKLK